MSFGFLQPKIVQPLHLIQNPNSACDPFVKKKLNLKLVITPVMRSDTSVLKMETVFLSETLVSTYKSTRRYKSADQHRHRD
jgi:hypothetical protein